MIFFFEKKIEYDIYNASENSIPLINICRIEQRALPLCLTPIHNSVCNEDFLLVGTSAAKIKMFHLSTFLCRKTISTNPFGTKYTKFVFEIVFFNIF